MADVIYKRLFFDWGGRCAYCDVGLSRQKTGGKVKASIDHFIPLSRGGGNGRSNRVLACYPCNLAKGDTDPRETNQWSDVERRLAEIAASPMLSHGKLRRLVPELVKQIGIEALSPEGREAIARSKADAERGEFATDEQVRAVWARHGL
jgi:hypothetical protein